MGPVANNCEVLRLRSQDSREGYESGVWKTSVFVQNGTCQTGSEMVWFSQTVNMDCPRVSYLTNKQNIILKVSY